MPATPSQMFEYGLNVVRGNWLPAQTALQHVGKLSTEVTFVPPPGRVVHLNASKEYEMGIRAHDMPLFLWSDPAGFDVRNPSTTPKGTFVQAAVLPVGKVTTLVATGAFEVQTTEFNVDLEYVANDLLTATASNSNATTGGRITNAGTGASGNVKQFVDPVCGVVSDGKFNNENGIAVLQLWPYFLPGAYA